PRSSDATGTGDACMICGEYHAFEMPEDVITAALDRRLVIFAGAGISTESRRVIPHTWAEGIATELGLRSNDTNFPKLMTEYTDRYGRAQLLQRIRERLDYIKAFPELLRTATLFHRELATAFFLDQIITTNWDTYFEAYADATPIVIPADYAFWDLAGRKVI